MLLLRATLYNVLVVEGIMDGNCVSVGRDDGTVLGTTDCLTDGLLEGITDGN